MEVVGAFGGDFAKQRAEADAAAKDGEALSLCEAILRFGALALRMECQAGGPMERDGRYFVGATNVLAEYLVVRE